MPRIFLVPLFTLSPLLSLLLYLVPRHQAQNCQSVMATAPEGASNQRAIDDIIEVVRFAERPKT